MLYDPRNDWHLDIIKAFHQSLRDDRYPPSDSKLETKRPEADNGVLRRTSDGREDPARTEGEGSEPL